MTTDPPRAVIDGATGQPVAPHVDPDRVQTVTGVGAAHAQSQYASENAPARHHPAGVINAMLPGREVMLDDGSGNKVATAMVYPAGAVHLQKFSEAISDAVPKILAAAGGSAASFMKKTESGELDVDWGPVLPRIVPILLSDLYDVIADCVSGVDLSDPRVPHWWLPAIAEAWMKESFDTPGKRQPWVEAVTTALAHMESLSPASG